MDAGWNDSSTQINKTIVDLLTRILVRVSDLQRLQPQDLFVFGPIWLGTFLAFLPGNVQKWIFVPVRLESNSLNEMAAGVCQGVGGPLGYFPHCTIFIHQSSSNCKCFM